MRRACGILTIIAGIALLGWVVPGAVALHRLLEDEGTGSFTASYGAGGILGCIAFLVSVALIGALLVFYGIHFWLSRT
jgi:hypothetical protein